MAASKDSFTFTVGKLDAGMAILLGERAHLIEFPSVLLPPGASAGSIVNISVTQNHAEESKRDSDFWDLQSDILDAFGRDMPEAPKLELRNVTQTSVTLEWPPLELATAKLRSLDIHRNGQRLASIPAPLQNTSTKLSGLETDHEYVFQLFLRTTAGVFPSSSINVRTHTMTNTTGIAVCFGTVQDPEMLQHAKDTLAAMGARWADKIQIDTTHFVCTTPAATPSGANATGNVGSAPGVEYQRALQLSIPVVQPAWILACAEQKKMVPIAGYYLGATPAAPMNAPPFARPQSMSQVSLAKPMRSDSAGSVVGMGAGALGANGVVPVGKANRASMPAMSRAPTGSMAPSANAGPMSPRSPETQARSLPPFNEASEAEESGAATTTTTTTTTEAADTKQDEEGSPTIPTISLSQAPSQPAKEATPAPQTQQGLSEASAHTPDDEDEDGDEDDPRIPFDQKKRLRKGTMDRNFRFPPTGAPPGTPPAVPAVPAVPSISGAQVTPSTSVKSDSVVASDSVVSSGSMAMGGSIAASASASSIPASLKTDGPPPPPELLITPAAERPAFNMDSQETIQGSGASKGSSGAAPVVPDIHVVAPSSIEVPPPPPVEKERKRSVSVDDDDEDVGMTEEIPL